jgi:hypothetical protein
MKLKFPHLGIFGCNMFIFSDLCWGFHGDVLPRWGWMGEVNDGDPVNHVHLVNPVKLGALFFMRNPWV